MNMLAPLSALLLLSIPAVPAQDRTDARPPIEVEAARRVYVLNCGSPCVTIVMTPQPGGVDYFWQAYPCGNTGASGSGTVLRESKTRIATDCFDDSYFRIKPTVNWEDVSSCDDLEIEALPCTP